MGVRLSGSHREGPQDSEHSHEVVGKYVQAHLGTHVGQPACQEADDILAAGRRRLTEGIPVLPAPCAASVG
jgi:hypothetical protein